MTPRGLSTSFELIRKVLEAIEKNILPKPRILCEPMLSKRGLYPNINLKSRRGKKEKLLLNLISYCDGKTELLEIAEKCNVPIWELYDLIDILKNNKVIQI